MKQEMVRAYVEKLLGAVTQSDRVVPDEDGDYPVRMGDGLYFVRISGDSTRPVIQLFTIAIADLPAKAKLFEAINQINSVIRFARCYWVSKQVFFGTELLAETLDPEELENAALAVSAARDHFVPQLIEQFGGRPFFSLGTDGDASADDADADVAKSVAKPSTPDGGYL